MNKTKLEVISMTNEDVIATSGLCAEYGTYAHVHVLALDVDGENDSYITYLYDSNTDKLVSIVDCSQPGTYSELDNNNFPGGASTGWWHSVGMTLSLQKCEDQSDEAHPVQ